MCVCVCVCACVCVRACKRACVCVCARWRATYQDGLANHSESRAVGPTMAVYEEVCEVCFRTFRRESDSFDFSFAPGHSGWNFNIGDSSNDGYGGDGGDSSNSAEVHNVDHNFLVFSNTLPGYANNSRNGHLTIDSIANVVNGNFTVVIGDEFVMFDDNNGVQRAYQSRYLFTLNGQATTDGTPDYLISLGMNRVIASNSRSGSGLCRATISSLTC